MSEASRREAGIVDNRSPGAQRPSECKFQRRKFAAANAEQLNALWINATHHKINPHLNWFHGREIVSTRCANHCLERGINIRAARQLFRNIADQLNRSADRGDGWAGQARSKPANAGSSSSGHKSA